MFLEIELKLRIAPQDVNLLLQHPLLQLASTQALSVEQLISRYFDTSDLALWKEGLSMRVREAGGRTIQTLKTAGEQIGDLQHRHEWDQPVTQNSPNIEQFTDPSLITKLKTILGDKHLLELFHTDFQRSSWSLNTEGTQIELVLDQGLVKTVTNQAVLHEIELELKQGDSQQLYKIAELLKSTIPLTVETRSKAERGYLLYNHDNKMSSNYV
ncbi:CYTH domain-containing protein [Rickettsiella endosymbiont of Litargus connexus]|jgi:triphosphatase|uniref:CYTH domain-containing protein n=1 Tax=Rickettsiella endosymbiont of Litargus connexus TaxID=3066237 RepID=UPI0027E9C74F|nr:CYTH domain-containing protein [Gammaproteobacteria bacterium]MCH9754518.1 CYTH domain-containing protein [Gammaproteobacteria bacterium]MDD4893408.1 CYTH domain-containing protein [Candidatus Rickettsiella isopodorum]MDD5162341.1 CYTH domain-containing protein [Candidatus Rickettsiella isopodorum]MDQ5900226.1 Adenylate cyclase [Pseudomonadota bacterium]